MKKLIIIRGLPGSGKSTLANKMVADNPSYIHIETDMFFMKENMEYEFDSNMIHRAHSWCLDTVKVFLYQDKTVIVSNTFTKMWEIAPYVEFCKKHNIEVEVITQTENFGSIHGVPELVMNNMRSRFETHEKILNGVLKIYS